MPPERPDRETVPSDRGLGSHGLIQPRLARSAAVSSARCSAILSTLKEISTATPDREGCRRLLECVSAELQAEQAVLILSSPLTRELEFVVHNQDPALPKMYVDYYGDLDPTGLPDYIKGNVSPRACSPIPTVFDLTELVDYGSLVSTEFYNDFFKAGGIHHDLVAFASAGSSARGALCLHRAHNGKPFTPEDVAILDMIAPFVGNHLEKMASASVLSVMQMETGKGIILCDVQGRVLYCNDVARDLCAPMRTADGTQRLVEDVSFVGYSLADMDALAENCNVEISCREVVLDQGRLGQLITLIPRDVDALAWAQPLKERFGMSAREIEVLNRVMAGGANKEIAQALFISEYTVKKHLQSIAAKVGAHTRTSIAHTVRRELGLTP